MQVRVERLRPDHHVVRYNRGVREQLLPPGSDGQAQHERGLFAAQVCEGKPHLPAAKALPRP